MTPAPERDGTPGGYRHPVTAWRAALAGFRFHATAGARVALRNTYMGVAAVLFFVIVGAPSPLRLVYGVARSLAAAGEPPWALAVMALLAVALSRAAVPQLTAGEGGWIRSLPLGAVGQRRALVVAFVLAQAPVLGCALASVIAVAIAPGMSLSAAKLLAMPAIAVGAALLGLPRRTRHVRWHGRGWLPQRVAWRALSWRVVPCTLPAAIPLAGAWFFRANNALTASEAVDAVRLCGVVAVTLVLAGLADALHLRRPVWAWARSLPWSSAQRVRHDAATLVAATAPVLLAIVMLDLVAALTVLAVMPLLALTAAGAIRRAGARRTAAAGEVLLVGVLVTTALALSPWSVVALVAVTPLVQRLAVHRERRASPSRWMELHHRVEGDSAFLGTA